jgi:uncharacterized membrane protein YdjX (TVP38/TMEM64 family)
MSANGRIPIANHVAHLRLSRVKENLDQKSRPVGQLRRQSLVLHVQHSAINSSLATTMSAVEAGNPAVAPPVYTNKQSSSYPVCCGINWRPIAFLRLFIFLFLVAMVVLVIVFYDTIVGWIEVYLEWIEYNDENGQNWISVLTFLGVLIVAIPCFMPSTIFMLSAGYIFAQVYGEWIGWVVAFLVCFVGLLIAYVIEFYLGRYVFREHVENLESRNELWKAIDIAVKHQGRKIVFLYKLTMIMPSTPFNYLISASSITFSDYMIGNLGMCLEIFIATFVGAQLSSLTEALYFDWFSNTYTVIAIIVGCVLAIALLAWVVYRARIEVARILAEAKAAEAQTNPTLPDYTEESSGRGVSLNASSERDALHP